MEQRGKIIVVEGLIGAGKSSFCQELGSQLQTAEVFLEPDEQTEIINPYLAKFYEDPERWAFTMQIHLMQSRYQTHLRAQQMTRLLKVDAIIDRSIYGDTCFAKLQRTLGTMSEHEYRTYASLYESLLSPNIQKPDLCVWLNVSVDTAYERVLARMESREGRRCEESISKDYLFALDEQIQSTVKDLAKKGIKVIEIPWNDNRPEPVDRLQYIQQVADQALYT
jgi:deoxyadenosine/deoxycytidine kinase